MIMTIIGRKRGVASLCLDYLIVGGFVDICCHLFGSLELSCRYAPRSTSIRKGYTSTGVST
jgi:hypothetical protein